MRLECPDRPQEKLQVAKTVSPISRLQRRSSRSLRGIDRARDVVVQGRSDPLRNLFSGSASPPPLQRVGTFPCMLWVSRPLANSIWPGVGATVPCLGRGSPDALVILVPLCLATRSVPLDTSRDAVPDPFMSSLFPLPRPMSPIQHWRPDFPLSICLFFSARVASREASWVTVMLANYQRVPMERQKKECEVARRRRGRRFALVHDRCCPGAGTLANAPCHVIHVSAQATCRNASRRCSCPWPARPQSSSQSSKRRLASHCRHWFSRTR
ncbi:hypothetical protein C8R45DRAFT_1001973 [Mycena sanguinolenta]|nr:hypothetical protein C8R45DRAFT_1001973 [Mycena sanguinolenta]